jgi:ATP-binding cassette subfamily F protein 3
LLIVEAGRVRVVDGNYDAYQLLLRRKAEAAAEEPAAPQEKKTEKPAAKDAKAKPARKRKFPFRKVADLEDEIFTRETRIEQLNAELGQEATYRSGDRVRQVKAEIAQEQELLKTLYEHWEEAAELNW